MLHQLIFLSWSAVSQLSTGRCKAVNEIKTSQFPLLHFHNVISTSVPLSLSLLQLSSSPGAGITSSIGYLVLPIIWPGSLSRSPLQDCVLTQYGVRECSQYPVQKPVEKCASVPQQTCVRSRLATKCKNVTQNVCRNFCPLSLTKYLLDLVNLSPPPLTSRKWFSK